MVHFKSTCGVKRTKQKKYKKKPLGSQKQTNKDRDEKSIITRKTEEFKTLERKYGGWSGVRKEGRGGGGGG